MKDSPKFPVTEKDRPQVPRTVPPWRTTEGEEVVVLKTLTVGVVGMMRLGALCVCVCVCVRVEGSVQRK